MLMALLPLASFAVDKTSISDWTVTLESEVPLVYSGEAQALPALTNIKKGETTITTFDETNWTVAWSFRGAALAVEGKGTDAGVYTLTITAKEANATYTGSVSKTFTISKKPVVVTATNPTPIIYGQNLPANDQFYEAVGYGGAGDPVTISAIDKTSAGAKEFTITAKENLENYTIVVPTAQSTGVMMINKAPLDVVAADFADFTYGAKQLSDITADEAATITGYVNEETVDVLGGELTFSVNSAADGSGTAFAGYGAKGVWYIIPGGLTSSNYDINFVNSTFTVGALTLSTEEAAGFSFTVEDGTYNASAYNPAPTVTWKGSALAPATTEPVAANDYSFIYTSDAAGNTPIDKATIISAKKYYVKITGAGNFTGSVVIPFDVKKAELKIRSKNQSKTYDAKAFTFPATLTYADAEAVDYYGKFVTISGLQGDDDFSNVFQGGAKLTLTQNAVLAGEHTITVGGSAADDAMFTNYTPKYGSLGVLTITPKTIYVQAKNVSKKYGDAIPEGYDGETVAIADQIIVGTSNVMNEDGQITADATALATNAAVDPVQDAINVYPMLTKATGTGLTKGDYDITVDKTGMVIKNGDTNVTASYDIQVLKGNYKISGKAFTIWADPKDSFYGEETKPLTASIEGMTTADFNTLKADINAALKLPANTTNAKEYDIELDEDALKKTIANGANAELWQNYETETFDFVSDKYTIKRAKLTVKAMPQVRMLGEKVIEDASATTIAFEGTAPTGNDLKLIYDALKLEYTLPNTIGTDDPSTTEIDESKALNAQKELCIAALTHGNAKADATHASDWDSKDGVWYDGIQITTTSFDAYNAANAATAAADAIKNYTLVRATVSKAQLTVTTDEVLELNAANVTASAAKTNTKLLEDNEGKKLNIRIKNKNLTAGYWYTISLPFDITPFDFCDAVGCYAIFDRLQQSGDKLNFKISMDAIPAYTPFLVKVEKDVKFKNVVFKKVNIVAPKTVTEENATWQIVNTIDEGDVTGLVYWLKQENDGITLDMSTTKGELFGFDAYITTITGDPATEARIFIEEPDGSTTAISAITADGKLVSAEGWYTLNGVKLQGMPTQKGVYINNGKKIVIK